MGGESSIKLDSGDVTLPFSEKQGAEPIPEELVRRLILSGTPTLTSKFFRLPKLDVAGLQQSVLPPEDKQHPSSEVEKLGDRTNEVERLLL